MSRHAEVLPISKKMRKNTSLKCIGETGRKQGRDGPPRAPCIRGANLEATMFLKKYFIRIINLLTKFNFIKIKFFRQFADIFNAFYEKVWRQPS